MESARRYEHRRPGGHAKLTEKQKKLWPKWPEFLRRKREDTILWVYLYTKTGANMQVKGYSETSFRGRQH